MIKIENIGILIVLGLFIILSGCSSSGCGCTNLQLVQVDLSYYDQQGRDLLNADHSHALDKYNLDLYYFKNGEQEGPLHYGSDFEFGTREDTGNVVHITFYPEVFEEMEAKIAITFPDSPTDTLEVEAESRGDTQMYARKIWYNGELLWQQPDEGVGEPQHFAITKTVAEN